MEQKSWAKTLLTIYNCLENITSAIDNLVLSQGINSGRNNLTTMESAQKIINLIQRKKMLINLKVLTEKIVASVDQLSARILILKYFDRVKPEVIYNILNISRRTYFRKLNTALENFGNKLKSEGYSSNVLKERLKNESWIIEMFENNLTKNEKESFEEEKNDEVLSFAIKKQKALKYC